MPLLRHAPVLVAAVVIVGCTAAPVPAPSPALDEIQGAHIAAHLRFLSLDLLEGRAPATRGGAMAAEYLAAQLAVLGLEPAGDQGTYFQDVTIQESVVDPRFRLTVGGGGPSFEYLRDVVAVTDRSEPRVTVDGEVVFVGHGIVAPELNWNDYAGVDMTGKIALVMVNDPPAPPEEPELFGGDALTYYGRWTYKYEEAARQGAAGAILIHTNESATYPWQVVQSSWSGPQYSLPLQPGAPALSLKAWLTESAARQLASRGGQDLDALRVDALRRDARPVPLGVRVAGTIDQEVAPRTSPNVIGVLRGTNPEQGVVFTAHYDHLGMIGAAPGAEAPPDRIFNGAIDNASGLAGVLGIVRALARAPARPVRSIYALFTTAEESGLLGAQYFALHPVLPATQWAANINVDGLNLYGRTEDLVLLGAERSSLGTLADALASAHGRRIGRDPEPGRGYFFRSDHFPLAKAGIPAVSLGEPTVYIGRDPDYGQRLRDQYNERDYHQPSDEFHSDWDYSGAVEDLRLLAELGWRIATDEAMPAYHRDDQFARPRAGG